MRNKDRAQEFFQVVALGFANDRRRLALDLINVPFWHNAHKFLELCQETTTSMCGDIMLRNSEELHEKTAEGRCQELN